MHSAVGWGGGAACRDFSPQKICKSSNYCEAFLEEERGEGIILGMGGGRAGDIVQGGGGGWVLF